MGACAPHRQEQAGEGAENGCERGQQRQAERILSSGSWVLEAGISQEGRSPLRVLIQKTIRTQYTYLDVFTRFCRKNVKLMSPSSVAKVSSGGQMASAVLFTIEKRGSSPSAWILWDP